MYVASMFFNSVLLVLTFNLTLKREKKKQFSWVTDIELNHKSLKEIMLIGRSRWKIENETGRHSAFNTLKNQGYHFEHDRAALRFVY